MNTDRARFTAANLVDVERLAVARFLVHMEENNLAELVLAGLEAAATLYFREYEDATDLPREILDFYAWVQNFAFFASDLLEPEEGED